MVKSPEASHARGANWMCPAIGLFRAGLLTLDHFAGQVSILGRSERQRLQVGTTAGCVI